MKFRHLLPALFTLPFSGCGFVGHTLGTVTNTASSLIRAVTAPVSGLLNVADEGSEQAWQQKADARTQQKQPHDRRQIQAKRAR